MPVTKCGSTVRFSPKATKYPEPTLVTVSRVLCFALCPVIIPRNTPLACTPDKPDHCAFDDTRQCSFWSYGISGMKNQTSSPLLRHCICYSLKCPASGNTVTRGIIPALGISMSVLCSYIRQLDNISRF